MPLETSPQESASSSPHAFNLAAPLCFRSQVIEGRQQLNELFARVIREGNAAIAIPPLALFVLGGAAANDGARMCFPTMSNATLAISRPGLACECQDYYGQPNLHESEARTASIRKR